MNRQGLDKLSEIKDAIWKLQQIVEDRRFLRGGGGGHWSRNPLGYLYTNQVGDVLAMGDGDAGAPVYSFLADLDTGMYRIGANNIGFVTNATVRMGIENTNIDVDVPIWAANGAAGAPSYSFDTETNLGIYRAAAGLMGFTSGGVQVAYIGPGQIRLVDGNVGAPSYSFITETDMGMYRIGADNLGFVTNGALRMGIENTNIDVDVPVWGINGVVGAPMYSFDADTETGMYYSATQLNWAVAGAQEMYLTATGLTIANICTANSFITTQNIGIAAQADLIQLTGANTMLVNGTLQATRIGINTAPTVDTYINVLDTAINTTLDFYIMKIWGTKTLGATNHNDSFFGGTIRPTFDQAAGEIGFYYGLDVQAKLVAGNVGDAVNSRSMYGNHSIVDVNGGKVWGDIYGNYMRFDIEAASEYTGSVYGNYIWGDDDANDGIAYMLYLYELSNIDYGFYQFSVGTPAPNYFGGRLGIGALATASEQLNLTSTTAALLLPRMTTVQKNAIAAPLDGMLVYDITLARNEKREGAAWVAM